MKIANERIEVVYQAYGLTKEGKWKPISGFHSIDKKKVEECIANHKKDVEKDPHFWTNYEDYKIMKRTEIHQFGEWEDAE